MNTVIILIKPVDAYYSTLTEEIPMGHKVPKINVGDTVRITNYEKIF